MPCTRLQSLVSAMSFQDAIICSSWQDSGKKKLFWPASISFSPAADLSLRGVTCADGWLCFKQIPTETVGCPTETYGAIHFFSDCVVADDCNVCMLLNCLQLHSKFWQFQTWRFHVFRSFNSTRKKENERQKSRVSSLSNSVVLTGEYLTFVAFGNLPVWIQGVLIESFNYVLSSSIISNRLLSLLTRIWNYKKCILHHTHQGIGSIYPHYMKELIVLRRNVV